MRWCIRTAITLCLICLFCSAHAQDSLWEDLGLYGGQMNAIAVAPDDPSILYAGSWMGDGLFKSTDSGKTWSTISGFRNYEVYDIEIDPHDSLTIWVANSYYVDVSRDGGLTWDTLTFAAEEDRFCFAVAVDPHDATGQTIYCGTGGPGGTNEFGEIFITRNGGESWENMEFVTDGNTWYNFWDINFNPNQPGEVWVANRQSQISPNGHIYVTPDKGKTWYFWTNGVYGKDVISFGYIDEVLVHPTDSQLVYLSSENGIARKFDGSSIEEGAWWYWTDVESGCRAMCIPPSAPDTIYAGLLDVLAKSTDAGDTWNFFDIDGDFLSLSAAPDDSELLFGGDVNSGVSTSTDGGMSWADINQGIRANTIYDTSLSPTDSSSILCATLSGVYKRSGTDQWQLINDSIPQAVSYHPQNPDIIYGGFDWKIKKSIDGGDSWLYIDVSDAEDAHRVSSFAIVPQTPTSDTVFAGISYSLGNKGEVLKITGWEYDTFESSKIVFTASTPVNAVAVNPQDENTLFVGTGSFYAPVSPGALSISTDGGKKWSAAIPDVVVNSIAIAPSDPNILYVGCGASNASGSGIYKSTDGGTTWTEKIHGLPTYISVSDIKVDSSDSAVVYAALYYASSPYDTPMGGVYTSLDGGNFWTQVGLSDYRLLDVNSYMPEGVRSARTVTTRQGTVSIPASTVVAGTSSGLYSSQTSGTGVILGEITSFATGDYIHRAQVSTNTGSNCLSDEGYYMLLVPSGAHTLRIQSDQYGTATSSVTVSAGRSVVKNILLTEGGTDNGTCAASQLFPGRHNITTLDILRRARDTVLTKSRLGHELTRKYYALGGDVLNVLERNPTIKKRSKQLIKKYLPFIRQTVLQKHVKAPASLKKDALSFLHELELASPDDLRGKLRLLRRKIAEENLENIFAR